MFIQGWSLLSSASINNGHYLKAATIKGAAFNQVNHIVRIFTTFNKGKVLL